MPFFKLFFASFFICTISYGQQVDSTVIDENTPNKQSYQDEFKKVEQNKIVVDTTWVSDNAQKQQAYLDNLRKAGQLEIYEQSAVEEKTKKYDAQARDIGKSSLKKATFSVSQYEGLLPDGEQSQAQDDLVVSAEPSLQLTSLKAIFVSFSMSNKELKDAFIEAGEVGAEIYFNGMHPDDENIGQTMRRLHAMGSDIEKKPSARFHPKAFEEFDVKSVPFVISLSKGKVLTVSGLLNFSWLDSKGENESGRLDYGRQGPTRPVIERSILEDIQLRLSRYDFESKKKETLDNFWSKQKFRTLPAATKNESWMIDPTVKVTKDIVNPKGEYLAKAGQIINPLATIPALNTYVLFNARDLRQLQWADEQQKSGKLAGTVMFMTSEVEKENGWDHLASLRRHFKQEIYLIPKEMIERFKVTGLPAVVSTDLDKKMLKVEQFHLE